MTAVLGADECVIADHGGGNPRRVPIFNVQASEELSAVGKFSGFCRIADLRASGLGWDLQDRWLEWYGPAGFTWGGVITGRPVEDGIAEIEAEGWAALLRGHLLTEFERVPEGGAGGLVRRAVIAANTSGPTFIGIGMIDEGGEPISTTFGGSDVLDDVLNGLSQDGAVEWVVDSDRTIHAARKLGRDVSARVRLVEDRHITTYRIADDAWAAPPDELWNFETLEESARRRYLTDWGSGSVGMKSMDPRLSLVAVVPESHRSGDKTPAGKHKRKRRRHAGRHQHHGQQNRRHHGKGGGGKNATMPPASPHWAASPPGVGANNPGVPSGHTLHLPTTPLELTVANVDDVWRDCVLGNTVRVVLGTPGFAGRFRIITRGIDASTGELHLAGEALED